MKKIIVFFISIVALYIISLYVRSYIVTQQTQEYVEVLTFIIAKPWNAKKIYDNSSASLKKTSYKDIKNRVEQVNSYLGNATRLLDKPKCELFLGHSSFMNKKMPYASCSIDMEFEKRNSTMIILLIHEDHEWGISYGSWSINDFNFEF
jgi:hypothetical protein